MISDEALASVRHRIGLVLRADTDDFSQLVKLAGLDPKSDLRFGDWSNIEFCNLDLRGFDFTGSKLIGCNFRGSLIAGSRFDQAVLGYVDDDRYAKPDLREAADWSKYAKQWRKSESAWSDGHLRPGMIFQDSPLAPEMIVIPSGEATAPQKTVLTRWSFGQPPDEISPSQAAITCPMIAISRWQIEDREFSTFLNRNKFRAMGYGRSPFQVDRRTKCTVSWREAEDYVHWLSEVTGAKYRLLNSDELTYALVGRNSGNSLSDPFDPDLAAERALSFGLLRVHAEAEWCLDEARFDAELGQFVGQPTGLTIGRRGARYFPLYPDGSSTFHTNTFRVARSLNT